MHQPLSTFALHLSLHLIICLDEYATQYMWRVPAVQTFCPRKCMIVDLLMKVLWHYNAHLKVMRIVYVYFNTLIKIASSTKVLHQFNKNSHLARTLKKIAQTVWRRQLSPITKFILFAGIYRGNLHGYITDSRLQQIIIFRSEETCIASSWCIANCWWICMKQLQSTFNYLSNVVS